MKIENYGIILHRLDESRLELMRNWRNSDYVSNRMIYTKYITEEEQKNWFEKINNDSNYYFVAEFNNEPVGVIHVKDIVNGVGEGGIFLVNNSYENQDIVPRMVACFNDFIFDELKLDHIYSKVRKDNHKAIAMSLAQGCTYDESGNEEEEYSKFLLFPENYQEKFKKIKKILNR
jgi:UDP-4-amino-4,6-dideoxy-N-acetyl-beta-L-altrosamine N-acetyltransferase